MEAERNQLFLKKKKKVAINPYDSARFMAKATGRGGWGGGGDGVGGGYGGGEGGGGRISILETRIGSSGDADFIAGASSLPLSREDI